ncbi:MAG: hypothetical protein KA604_03810 [Candidatus Saccharimonas sp.]|nr:hypothetical protein [Candidatus Saccharimonas sp.]
MNYADMAELVDALASGASERKFVEVRTAGGSSETNFPTKAMLLIVKFGGRGT